LDFVSNEPRYEMTPRPTRNGRSHAPWYQSIDGRRSGGELAADRPSSAKPIATATSSF
jgi:hypothetical protein